MTIIFNVSFRKDTNKQHREISIFDDDVYLRSARPALNSLGRRLRKSSSPPGGNCARHLRLSTSTITAAGYSAILCVSGAPNYRFSISSTCDLKIKFYHHSKTSTMPVLAKKWFKETGDIGLEIADSLVTAGLGQAASQTFAALGWDGKLAAGIALELSPDNRHVRRSEFLLRGLP